jgi:copper oxidase (laccase) domain-containing protein
MRPSDFVINQTEDIRWLSFPPLNAFPFILHGLIIKGRNPTEDSGRKTPGKLLKTIIRHEARFVSLSQMHRDECVTISSRDQIKRRYTGDAVLTDRNERGTLLGIAPRTLEKAKHQFGCEPGDFTVLFGPCIQSCCYRVSDDAAILFDTECVSRSHDGGRTLDLARANLKQFAGCGVKEDKIFVVGDCTHCEEQLYHSYRREKEDAGRMIGFLGLK